MSPRTLRGDFYCIKRFVDTTGLSHVDEITTTIAQRYIMQSRQKHEWAIRTVRNNIQALQSFLDFCVEQHYIADNPIRLIPMPKLPKDLPKAFSYEDAMRLMEWTYIADFRYDFNRYRARAILATFLFTGIRRSELLNLKFSDVRIKDKTIRVENGKGRKDRLIPMNRRLIEILNDYIKSREKEKKTTIYFFATMRGDKRMQYSSIRRIFDRMKQDLNMKIYCHKLRHTFATLMLRGNCDVYSLSNMMGHSDLKTTTIYLTLTMSSLKDQIGKHPLGFKEVLPHQKFVSKPFSQPKDNQWLY